MVVSSTEGEINEQLKEFEEMSFGPRDRNPAFRSTFKMMAEKRKSNGEICQDESFDSNKQEISIEILRSAFETYGLTALATKLGF